MARGQIPTLRGNVTKEQLGSFIDIHEHVYTDPPLSRMIVDRDYKIADPAAMVQELKEYAEAGCKTLVDCTCLDYGRNAKIMLDIAEQVPEMNILGVTGWNRGNYAEWTARCTKEEMVALMLRDIEEGMDGTNAKPALIKIGTDYNKILPIEQTIMEAAGTVHKLTGTPIITHTHLGTMCLEQVETLSANGVDPNLIAISHMDHNLDFYYLSRLMKGGSYALFCAIGQTKYCTDERRIEMIQRICDAGLEDRLLISGDFGRASYIKAMGGGPGFAWIIKKFVARLREEGFPPNFIDKVFRDNPARLLAGETR